MITLHENSLATRYIQNLVATTPIPTLPFFDPSSNTPRYNGSYYVSRDGVYVGTAETEADGATSMKFIKSYTFGESLCGVTSTYVSNCDSYDPRVHYYLGEYLRALKNFKSINLMPLYNCFGGQFLSNVSIKDKQASSSALGDLGYSILAVPVKYDKTYTIALDSDEPVELCAAYVGRMGLLFKPTNTLASNNNYVKHAMCRFQNPVTWDSPRSPAPQVDAAQNLLALEPFLTLLIKVPSSTSSSVVVLEGVYPNTLSEPEFESASDRIATFVTNDEAELPALATNCVPSLLRANTQVTYAFSDKLISYLVQHPVTSEDTFMCDITQVQDRLQASSLKAQNDDAEAGSEIKPFAPRGVWSAEMSMRIFQLVQKAPKGSNIDKRDCIGFVDKDAETYLSWSK